MSAVDRVLIAYGRFSLAVTIVVVLAAVKRRRRLAAVEAATVIDIATWEADHTSWTRGGGDCA